jgi:hypothetical protein
VPDVIDPVDRIDALLNSAEPRIARAFRAAITSLKNDLDLDLIEQLLVAGQVEEALAYTQDVARAVGAATTVTFYTAGQDTATFLSGLDLGTILLDQVNVRAVNALQTNNLRLITEFTNEQREATRLALLDGIARGLNPKEQARNFRDSVGLTEKQQAAVLNYRDLLQGSSAQKTEALSRSLRDKRFDRTVQSAAAKDLPLSDEQITRMVSRYRDRYVKYRSEVIGRTEALRSVHEGVNEAYQQAIDGGKIDQTDLVREWDSSRDSRVRRTHVLLNGQKKNWGEAWHTINGTIRYPGDPQAAADETIQCRCVLTTRIKGAKLKAA